MCNFLFQEQGDTGELSLPAAPEPRERCEHFRPGMLRPGGIRISKLKAAAKSLPYLLLLALLLCGCATPEPPVSQNARRFEFERDTFAFPNELVWEYFYDSDGKWTSRRRTPEPTYSLHCFVLARTARQFFLNARFEPELPSVDADTYRRLIHQVASTNPRRALPEDKQIVIPGYPDLRTFSEAQEDLLKAECGSAWESYFQRSHWRMIFPFSRDEQSHMAERLLKDLKRPPPVVVHVVRFPQLSINHALVLFDVQQTDNEIQFIAYDPNQPESPTRLTYQRETRTFLLPPNHYFPGGRVDVYEIYHKWDY